MDKIRAAKSQPYESVGWENEVECTFPWGMVFIVAGSRDLPQGRNAFIYTPIQLIFQKSWAHLPFRCDEYKYLLKECSSILSSDSYPKVMAPVSNLDKVKPVPYDRPMMPFPIIIKPCDATVHVGKRRKQVHGKINNPLTLTFECSYTYTFLPSRGS